ncbi:hypothetical protein QZH41_003530 [Actinostola sp. cb2023]|nr:hypothetical protein QZH41_003530 [Actinostola sp. cb2023]
MHYELHIASQSTAMDNFGHAMAYAEQTSNVIDNDGTNSCAFLSVILADMLISLGDELPIAIDEWGEIGTKVEEVIMNAPRKFNPIRDINKKYDPLESYTILKEGGVIQTAYEFTEELLLANKVYSPAGRHALMKAVNGLHTLNDTPRIGTSSSGSVVDIASSSASKRRKVDNGSFKDGASQDPVTDADLSDKEGILDAEDSKDLKKRLMSIKDTLSSLERTFLKKGEDYDSQFWKYLYSNRKMMGKTMTTKARQKAGMPCDEGGKPLRCYSNQSECINNVLTRQKEAFTGDDKAKKKLTKLEFIRDVWCVVENHQEQEVQLALCGQSDDLQLAECAAYLQVEPDIWFNWSPQQRAQHAAEFHKLSMADIFAKKKIDVPNTFDPQESTAKEFSFDLQQELVTNLKLDKNLAEVIFKEAEKLLNTKDAVQKKPSLEEGKIKYLVAARKCKKGMYECVVSKNHVTCTCQAYRYNNVCKHSLVVAEKMNVLREHLDILAKSSRLAKPSRRWLIEPPSEVAGKKGGQHKNQWRKPRADPTSNRVQALPKRPYTEIHHNDNPINVVFLDDFPKALNCKQCGVTFPRKKKTIPYDIVLSHEEKWLYPDPNNRENKLPSSRYTVRFYCKPDFTLEERLVLINRAGGLYRKILTKVVKVQTERSEVISSKGPGVSLGEKICDVEQEAIQSVANEIKSEFPSELSSGLMRIINAPRSYYPSLENLPGLWKDKPKRVQWRSKQCLDYAFLFDYSKDLGFRHKKT